MMWEVVYADGRVNELEDNIIWRVADLLGVTTRQRVQLRQQIAPDRAVLPASLAGRPSYQDLAAAVATESI
jgi:Tellurite resistance protein TerB